jgi:hypothetical protein
MLDVSRVRPGITAEAAFRNLSRAHAKLEITAKLGLLLRLVSCVPREVCAWEAATHRRCAQHRTRLPELIVHLAQSYQWHAQSGTIARVGLHCLSLAPARQGITALLGPLPLPVSRVHPGSTAQVVHRTLSRATVLLETTVPVTQRQTRVLHVLVAAHALEARLHLSRAQLQASTVRLAVVRKSRALSDTTASMVRAHPVTARTTAELVRRMPPTVKVDIMVQVRRHTRRRHVPVRRPRSRGTIPASEALV